MDLLLTGCYRSGTTLLEKLLNSQPQVTVASQPMPALYHVVKQRFLDERGLQRRYPLDHLFLEDAYTAADLAAFLDRYRLEQRDLDEVFAQLSRHAEGHWTPEIAQMRQAFSPGTFAQQLDSLRGCIARLFPKAEPQRFVGSKEIVCEELVPFLIASGRKCIIILRDPRDVVASVNFGVRDTGMGAVRPVLYTLRAWRKSVAYALALADHPNVAVVRYEALAAQPEATLRALLAALGLPPPAGELVLRDQRGAAWAGNSAFDDASGVTTQPVGRFERMLPPEVRRYVETACLPEMRALGYPARTVSHFDASVLAGYRPDVSRMHAKFEPDYDHAPPHVEQEQQRYEHLVGPPIPLAEQKRWFLLPEAYARLRIPRLLFLGAGPNQLPGIRKAVELGWHVTTVDDLEHSPGHRIAHARERCSTTDAAGILAIARRLEARGIATFASDAAAPTVSSVARTLGLPGGLPDAVASISLKSGLRRIQRDISLPAPGFVVAATVDELEARLPSLTGTLVFKPEDASGSKGISAADAGDRAACIAAFEYARKYARCGGVCVEEMLAGQHLSADGYIEDGRVAQMLCTDKQRAGFNIRGHVVPAPYSGADVAALRKQVETIAAHVGLESGFFDLDAVITATGPVIIEISPRLGGNGIPLLFERSAGLALTEASLRRAMGEPFTLSCSSTPRTMASWVFGAPMAGSLASIADERAVRENVPELEHLMIARSIGESVRPMENGADLIGIAIFAIPAGSSFDAMTAKIETALRIKVQQP